MITNAVYAKDGRKRLMTRYVLKRMLANLLRYRYRDVKLVYVAVRDFCRGILSRTKSEFFSVIP